MKVVLVTESLGPGGAERQIVGLAVMLKNRGFDVFVLTYYRQDFYKSVLDENGIPNEVYYGGLNRFLRFIKLSHKVNSLSPNITISFLPGSNVALGLAKMMGLLKSYLVVSERNYTLKWTLTTKIYFSLYKKADAIVANSKAEAQNITSIFPYYSSKVSYIYNFVDYEKFKPIERSQNESFKIITVARLIAYKNVVGLIKAASLLKKEGYLIEFDWFGFDYNDNYSVYVKKLIREENVADIFRLHNPIKNIHEYYPLYDAFCLPSFKEGYPNVIVEAMSCQLPVLCSNICDNPVIVENNINGFLFDPHDVNSIVSSIYKMYLLSEEKRNEMGIQNRKKVIHDNAIESFTDKYVQLIKKIVK